MASIVYEYLKNYKRRRIVLADPFLGSARTLTVAIRKIGADKLRKVWGIEPLPLPALIAYASLLQAVRGKKDTITVITGDAFREVPRAFSPFTHSEPHKADVILTNPPFTRWKCLERGYRDYLLEVVSGLGYEEYITRREASLQTLAMFLADYILTNGGLIGSVLPASTFYTIYGRGYKSLLRKNYETLAVVESASRPSFSEDSGFKEIIIAAIKGNRGCGPTLFVGLDNNAGEIAKALMNRRRLGYRRNSFDIRCLPRFLDINWLALFGKSELRDILVKVFEGGLTKRTLGYWGEVLGRGSIIRGVEMYGPEFFFVPNKHWRTAKENRSIVEIENVEEGSRLTLNREILVRTLRKPSLYSRTIEAQVDSYMLSIPPAELNDLPEDLQDYIRWGIDSGTAKPAINAHGKYWYSHVHRQMVSKKPFGRVFIPDKVDLTFKRRGVFVNYTDGKVAASKNFYIIKDENETLNKLLVGWFNCTIFFSTLILLGRKISETWTRFLEDDYVQLPVINPSVIDEKSALEVCKHINGMLNKSLPPFWDQLGKEYRYRLDLSLAEAIKLENPERIVEELYQTLFNYRFTT